MGFKDGITTGTILCIRRLVQHPHDLESKTVNFMTKNVSKPYENMHMWDMTPLQGKCLTDKNDT